MARAETFFTFTTDNIGSPETVTANTRCNRITVQENGDATQNLRVRRSSASSTGLKLMPGQSFSFIAPQGTSFAPGEVVGWIETLAGSVEVAQIEEL